MISLFIIFISLSCVCASDLNETDATGFTQLNHIINQTDASVDLTCDYSNNNTDSPLIISKSIEINGNGHSIDCNGSSIFINQSNILFRDVTFRNVVIEFNSSIMTNLTFVSCNFDSIMKPSEIYFPLIQDIDLTEIDSETMTAGEISQTVSDLAKMIAGNATDLDAAILLAQWVGTNITHEGRAGFYQSPDQTLLRQKGNCCSQTLLFLQMCASLGITENHRVYIVHTGTMKFGERHFFAMIDNIFVDVDARPKHPWGNALIKRTGIYRITEYPYLPLVRKY